MRLGAIVRPDISRGVGAQSSAFARWMRPDRLLLIDARKAPRTTTHRWDLFTDFDTMTVSLDDTGDPDIAKRFYDGLDVVYTVETNYWPGAYDVARSVGCRTVTHINHELNPHPRLHPEWPKPDVFAMPTVWCLEQVPGAVHLPFPVDRSQFPYRRREHVNHLVHVVGMRAMHDRNGTIILSQALNRITHPCRITIHTQDPDGVGIRLRPPSHVELEVVAEDIPDPTGLYNPYDALILPRRYGGLCLPAQEAASMGLPVVMPDITPQNTWLPPDLLISATKSTVRTMAGILRSCTPGPWDLARIIDRLVGEPGLAGRMSDAMDHYAESISWRNMEPLYRTFFEAVAAGEYEGATV